ncbi:hypothetical protein LEP1GSC044_1754 [Leptospira kirschneri serovar Grippotyphosa str. RM52]|nr:hypothetical protein LEP1GSC044_1754 [Leptospira kirschneri serovar Grippotyphosa str. RM52]EMK04099.1 hypothetical protein LEP1GSC176_2427 [Leptospira kirschneri str. MMD1493]
MTLLREGYFKFLNKIRIVFMCFRRTLRKKLVWVKNFYHTRQNVRVYLNSKIFLRC